MIPADRHSPSDADIHAYVDGRIAPEARARIEASIVADPALAARVAELRAQNAALRDALDAVLAERIPDALLAAATSPGSNEPMHRRWIVPALGAAASLVVGTGFGWFARDALIERDGTPTTFARQAAFAHALYAGDVNRPVEIWAKDEKRLVAWLTRRLGFGVYAPDLKGLGFALVGGRLVAGNEQPTALLMYENADKQRLSLQVRKQAPGTDETAFRYVVENGVGVFYWIDEACGYALSGNVDRAQHLEIAHVVHGQLAAADSAASR